MNDFSVMSWPAPAKINLFLRIVGRRQDGYHNIQTLFQLLDWGDEVRISPTRTSRITRLASGYGVSESDDLTVRAAKLLQSETGCRQGAEIAVEKRVPLGSGMGGGSSDAATVLLALNDLWACGLGLGQLARMGRTLGADVPVFVHGRSAMAEGVGEKLTPVELGERFYVLVFPALSISTREVFLSPDLPRNSKPISLSDALAGEGGNDCEAVVRKRFPAIDTAMKFLRKWGRPVMTGTGSGIYLAMRSEKSAKSAAKEIKTLYNVRAVRGLDRSPLHDELDRI